MNYAEQNRNTEDVLQELWDRGGCNEEQTCTCPIHALLERTLADYKREREKRVREEFERQEAIIREKQNTDFST